MYYSDRNLLDAAKNNSLEILCSKIIIRQQTKINPAVYVGTGLLKQNKNGGLALQAIWKNAEKTRYRTIDTETLSRNLAQGTVFPRDIYFSIEATSVSGEVWVGSDIYLDSISFGNTESLVLKGEILSIEQTVARSQKPGASFAKTIHCTAKNFTIAQNKVTDMGELGAERNKTEIKILNIDCIITKVSKEYICIDLLSKKSISEELAKGFINGLEIICGLSIEPLIEITYSKTRITKKVYSITKLENEYGLGRPIPCTRPDSLGDINEFLSKYCRQSKIDRKKIEEYWKEVKTARESATEAYAKALAANAEGLLDAFFFERKVADIEFRNQCQEWVGRIDAMLSELKVPPRVQRKLLSNLENAGAGSVRSAFYELFGKDTAEMWNSLRHPSMHGSMSVKYPEPQELFKDLDGCLYIFYSLIMMKINYNGKRYNYAKQGYPIE
ncbi:hypothetical protein [Halopseudomonas pelagia]|uniref:hypothetical protein n=1 Tax=Halopseudomonas pelagia TaxID=553151 RepID=UPI00039FEC53|nr:hypothetical protein [Halopseudomonas pelagia]